METHEEELQRLFLESTVSIDDTLEVHNIRAISFNLFKELINKMMDKAYMHGKWER